MDNKYERFNPDVHPPEKRCNVPTTLGQECPYVAVAGDRCPLHMAGSKNLAEKDAANQYRLGKWQARMAEFAGTEQLKSLRGEIGMLRMLLEEVFNSCTSSSQLLLQSQKINDLVTRVERLVVSCHKLEQSTGFLIDKPALLLLAAKILSSIEENVPDRDVLDKISSDLVVALDDLKNGSE